VVEVDGVRRGKSVVWDECCRLDDREGIDPARFGPLREARLLPQERGDVWPIRDTLLGNESGMTGTLLRSRPDEPSRQQTNSRSELELSRV
jgi:hypothetical protein